MDQVNIVQALRRAANSSDKGITLVGRDEDTFISYNYVLEKSMFLANHLTSLGLKPGDKIVLQCQEQKNSILSFWACALGGFVAVPVEPRNSDYRSEMNDRIFEILDRPFLLYDQNSNAPFSLHLGMLDFSAGSTEKSAYQVSQDDVLYIQFTSGSTGIPKGAVLRHSNIVAEVYGLIERYQMNEQDLILSWQTLNHCYGLVAHHLLAVALGVNQYLIPTELYMQNPLIWFDLADRYRVTRVGSIPFALKNFVSFYQQSRISKQWDLSSIKTLFIGSEQVQIDLCSQFTNMMKKHKLFPGVIMPVYGLSETSCIATASAPDQLFSRYYIEKGFLEIGQTVNFCDNQENCISFAGVGKAILGTEVRITDDRQNPLPACTTGHVQIRGGVVAHGYYADPESSQESFDEDGWLNTGDLGFLHNGELVIVGRKKELIVINGLKYACNMIEDIIRKNLKNPLGALAICNATDSERKSEGAVVFIQYTLDFNDRQKVGSFVNYGRMIREIVYENFGFVIDQVLPIKAFPRTGLGKIKRRALGSRYDRGEFSEITAKLKQEMADTGPAVQFITLTLVEIIRECFELNVTDYDLSFQDCGLVSINAPVFIERVNKTFHVELQVASFFNYPNIRMFSEYLCGEIKKVGMDEGCPIPTTETIPADRIAIVGMSCRFPGGADCPQAFWDILMNGTDGIVDIPKNRWKLEDYYSEDENEPGKMYCKKGGFLREPIDEFDAQFFNIAPKEAVALDPQQRMLLELTWEAFENADLDIADYHGSNTGVYIGISSNEYMMAHLYSGDHSNIDAYSLTGASTSTACGRVSYTFGFEGPSLTVDTACSSSLSAFHIACKEMLSGETDLAVVGGINLMITPTLNIGFTKLRATSPDGHSKSFDASANGYGRGEGGGIILLKPLSKAQQDNDNILGVVCGTCINQDGKSNGLTAPSGKAQVRLIERTLSISKLQPIDVDYVEMHGTGTPLGDPIEVGSVSEVYCKNRESANPLKIGSVKSNIGHLEAAAGIASIVKVLLSFQHDVIPANLHYADPNPMIHWDRFPTVVVDKNTEWLGNGRRRRAAINGFGFGGSNAHVILEDYPKSQSTGQIEGRGLDYILKISAKNHFSLQKSIERYADAISDCSDEEFGDFVYSANRGRTDLVCRFAVTGGSRFEILEKIRAHLAGDEPESVHQNKLFLKDRKVVFMFTGQGSQYLNMGRLLFDTQKTFRDTFLLCDRLFQPYILKSIVDLIYGDNSDEELIEKTQYAQPLIFSIEYALCKFWENCGITPDIVMGHSIGEYAAALVSDIFTLEDAVKLVSIRGRLMDAAPGKGAMGTVFAEEAQVESMLQSYQGRVSIAACNARDSCVISGEAAIVEDLLEKAARQGIRVKELKVSHGFHSKLMEPIMADFKSNADNVIYKKAGVRFVSSLYAREIEEILDARYWTDHIRGKVDFYHALTSIPDHSDYIFLEIGSNRVLSALFTLIFDDNGLTVNSMSLKKPDTQQVAEAIALLYVSGANPNWKNIECKGQTNWRKLSLPGCYFDRNRYWKDLLYDRSSVSQSVMHPLLGQRFESPYLEGATVFQSLFSSEKPYFMREHVIFGAFISPAAAHISMMLSAVRELAGPKSCILRGVEMLAPLVVYGEEERTVQICIDGNIFDSADFSIVSRDTMDTGADWLVHAKGKVGAGQEFAGSTVHPEDFEGLPFNYDTEQGVYFTMQSSGFYLGDSFRRIKKTFCENGRGVCFIEPLRTIPDANSYELYPGVVDSVLQTILCMILEKYNKALDEKGEGITIIPYHSGEIIYNYKKADKMWCKVKSRIENDIVYGDIEVFNEIGETVMLVKDFLTKITKRDTLLAGLSKSNYYHLDWLETERNTPKRSAKKYVIIADEFERELSRYLSVTKNDTLFAIKTNAKSEDFLTVDVCDKDSIKSLLERIVAWSDQANVGFVYVVGNNSMPKQFWMPDTDYGEKNLKGLLYLSQLLDSAGLSGKSALTLVTMGAQSGFGSGQSLVCPEHTLLLGFARTLQLEYPRLNIGMVDIELSDFSTQAECIAIEIRDGVRDEVCLRGGKRYVRTLVPGIAKKGHSISIREDGTYLITGGTGAVGMSYAKVLIEKGAKYLILLCRRKPVEAVREKCAKWAKSGIRVEIVCADVADRDQLTDALQNVCLPPVRGVIHAAGILRDGMISNLTWDTCEAVLRPKVQGVCNVYSVFEKEELDFFLMISSLTAILGNVGQSIYAAANCFMNGFAEWMQAQAKPGFAYCWGPWETGMAGNEIVAKNLNRLGIRSFAHETTEEMIFAFFDKPYTNTIAADVEWEKYMKISDSKQNTFYSKVVIKTHKEKEHTSGTTSVLEKLKNMTQEDRKDTLVTQLQHICGKILGYGQGQQLQADKSFKELGADSLMLFSIRSSVNKLLEIDLNVSAFFNYPTLFMLTEYLIDDILFPVETVRDDLELEIQQMISALDEIS